MPTKPNRESIACSLPPDLRSRLVAESDNRVLAPSVLIERALVRLFAEFDRDADPTAKASDG